jgi:hypothetical protein
MIRKSLVGFIFLALFSITFAQVDLSNFDFNGIYLNKENTKLCETIFVDLPQELDKDAILSVKAAFFGVKEDNSYVSVKINNGKEKVIWPEFFSCAGEECLARVFVPELKHGETAIRLCLNSGGKTTKAELFEYSTIGFYKTPVFSIENIAPDKIFLGERAKMKIVISNEGELDANVFVQFIAEDLRTLLEITSFDIVEGDTSAEKIILANSSEEFVYYIKPSIVSSYNLPSAVLSFTMT